MWYVKYFFTFIDIDGNEYRVEIFAWIPYGDAPDAIELIPSENEPLVIEEDNSDDFFEPVRTKTGRIKICTRLVNGGTLNLSDILPVSNKSNPVNVKQVINGDIGSPIFIGFLGCEMYNQAYIGIPEMISIPIISTLEAWKNFHISENKITTPSSLLNSMRSITPYTSRYSSIHYPIDGVDFMSKSINTSIFIDKKEYIDEEAHFYRLEGESYFDIVKAICTFMGWVAREDGRVLYFEKMQGYGLLDDTQTKEMSLLTWRGTGHQRSIRQGKRFAQVTAKLKQLNIDMNIPEIPYGSFALSQYQQIGPSSASSSSKPWVYFLPSAGTDLYSNLTFNFYEGKILMGHDFYYDFQRTSGDANVGSMCYNSIPCANTNSYAYKALNEWDEYTILDAGACLARMQFDEPTSPDYNHTKTKDGLFVCLFPGAWKEHTVYTQPIFEMRSVQAFAASEEGYLNIQGILKMFTAGLSIGTTNPEHILMIDLQIGDMVFTGDLSNPWKHKSQHVEHFFSGYNPPDNNKLYNYALRWQSNMDIDQVDGICIPTFYTENGETKHVMGEVIFRIYPETKFYDKITTSDLWRNNMVFNIFFESLDIKYYPKKSVERTNRSENNYRREVNNSFYEEASIDTEFASWLHNNPSPSLVYNSDQTPMETLTYTKSDNTTEQRRPEQDLLNRMDEYYKSPRTILKLEVGHLDDKPLPLIRLNGINDGKVYVPLSENRNFKTNVCTLTCFETP